MSGTDSDIWTNGNTPTSALARSAPATTGVGNELSAYRPAPTGGQLAVNSAAAQAELDQVDARLDDFTEYADETPDAHAECLSGADTERLRSLW